MATASENSFSPWDYVVFAAVLAISAGIGIFYGFYQKQKTTEDFLMAGRKMSVFPVAASLLASFMSAITLLGTPSEIYVYGTMYMTIWVGYIGTIFLAAQFFIPVFYELKLTSVFEYLEMRFDKGIRLLASIFYLIQTLLYMAIVLYAPSLALNAVTGLNVWISVFVVGIVCIFYTSVGGMKAVMWTDTFQIFCMFGGLMAVIIKGSNDFDGFSNIWQILKDGDRVEFWDFNPDPTIRHSFWTLSIGATFTWVAIFGVNQSQVQRALTVPTLRKAQLALWVNLPGLTGLMVVCSLCGAVVYAQYRGCDPLTRPNNQLEAKDQLLPLYVMDMLADYPGIPGLFIACLFSGALSTLSSGLNSLSAITVQDMIKLFCFPDLSESRATLIAKLLGFFYGAIMIGLTFIAANMGGVLQAALGLFGMIGGPTMALFSMGIMYPCVNKAGAYAGFITSLTLTIWLGIGATVVKPGSPKKPVSIANCSVAATETEQLFNSTMSYMSGMMSDGRETTNMMTTEMMMSTTTDIPSDDEYDDLPFYQISYIYYAFFALLVCHSVGLVVSFCTVPNKPGDIDPRLCRPLSNFLCCCLPRVVREGMWCGVQYDKTDDWRERVEIDVDYDSKDSKTGNGRVNYGLDPEVIPDSDKTKF